MARITLSRTGAEYVLAVNGWNKTDDALSLTVIASDESLDEVERIFANNEVIKMHDASVVVNATGYTEVEQYGKHHDYIIGGLDDEGNDLTADVWIIVLKKQPIESRVADLEDAVAELGEIVGGE